MIGAVLAMNAGSSSLKFAVYWNNIDGLAPVSNGEIEGIGTAPHFVARDTKGVVLADRQRPSATFPVSLGALLDWLDDHLGGDTLAAAGHRVVPGGRDFTSPVRLTNGVVTALDALTPLSPPHQPHSPASVRATSAQRPELPQVACLDTTFHHTMQAVATRFALPPEYEDERVHHYGFHGLSYEFIARRMREIAPRLSVGRLIVAHLGSGASLCAMRTGISVDTTPP